MPTGVIYQIESVEEITTKSGRVTVAVILVDEDGTSLKAFTISCLQKDLKDLTKNGSSYHQVSHRAPETQAKTIITMRSCGANGSMRS